MQMTFEIVRRQHEADRDRKEDRESFARSAPDADVAVQTLGKRASHKAGRAIELDDMPEELRGKVHVERDGDMVRVYSDKEKSRELFTADEDRLKSERVDRRAIAAMVAVVKHRDWDRIAIHGEEKFRREAWLEASARKIEVTGYNPTQKDVEEMGARQARYQAQELAKARDRAIAEPIAEKASTENVIEFDRTQAGAGRDAAKRDEGPASHSDKTGDLDAEANRSGFRERNNGEELLKRQALEAQLERNLRVKHPDNETLVEKGIERARVALDDLQRQGKSLPEIKVADRMLDKRFETQIDRAHAGPTVDDMRENIRQQERNRDRAKER